MTESKVKKPAVSVFYAKKSAPSAPQDRPKKTTHRKNNRFDDRAKPAKEEGKKERFSSRIETFNPKNTPDQAASPWKKQPAKVKSSFEARDRATFSDKRREPSQQNAQSKNELYVYGENSCKAIFNARPESIVKVFVTESLLDRFRDILAVLAQNKIGYDIVTSQRIEQLTQTAHHGGVAMIVKRRKAASVINYLQAENQAKSDVILSIDDIQNPHNLGGIARTAAFFNVNALMVRQPEAAENNAAIKVSEGGMESLDLIKADDLIADLMQLKKAGYKIIALLPVKTQSIKSIALERAKFSKGKTVFVIFQQINERVTDIADDVISLQGSHAMPALNISVLVGILLATWRNRLHQSYP